MAMSTGTPDVLEAAIADARRHARGRRLRNAAVVLALLAAAASLVHLFGRGAATTAAQPAGVASAAVHNGPITILANPANPPAGWYGVSRVGSDGRLHPFVRCPDHAEWCGEPESLAWTARGDRLALSVTSFGMANPYNGVHVIDTRTHADTQIRTCNDPPGECDWFDLAWSPDGKTLAYISSGNVVLVDADGGNRRLLATPPGRKSSPAWSPSGTQIAFADELDGHRRIFRVDLDGRNLRRLTGRGTAPAWSRTGLIAYHTDCGIRLMRPDGTPVIPRTARSCGAIGPPHLAAPSWSPDGKRIAATRSTRRPAPFTRGTYVMRSDGTDVERVTSATLSVFIGQRPRIAWQPLP